MTTGDTRDKDSAEPGRAAGSGATGDPSGDTRVGARGGADRRGPSRTATWLAVLTAVTVLAGAAAAWFAVEERRLRGGNAAFADPAATTAVVEETTAMVQGLLSYSHRDLARTERVAEESLVGRAAEQYRSTFDKVLARADEEETVRATTVREVGVRELDDARARVLVFVDQQTIPADGGAGGSETACLELELRRIDGAWRIARLRTV